MKKEKFNYFNGFIKGTDFSVQCINLLSQILGNFNNNDLSDNIIKMHNIEHNADDEKHLLTSFLHKDFLPPIEREDIISLSHKIDNLTDNIEEILINIDIFNVKTLKPEVFEFINLLVTCCNAVNDLIISLKNFKKDTTLENKIIEINHLEEDGDNLYSKYMRKLYRESQDATDTLIWTQIFNCFEHCFDSCEEIANNVQSIILKNS